MNYDREFALVLIALTLASTMIWMLYGFRNNKF